MRPREFDNEEVLNALRDVFWERGYDGASYTDIMKATGLQKGSLYAIFGDKRALYQHALARYDEQEVRNGIIMLRDGTIAPAQRLQMLMQSPVDAAGTKRGRWGCFLCNAAIDQAPTNLKTESTVTASMGRLQAAIDAALKDLSLYERSLRKRESKAASLLAGYFGLRVLVKAGLPKSVIAIAAKDMLDGISTNAV